ncbi:MAG TPA: hypothetical protein VJ953_15785 [Saprospiraceae bacterium]|nr:hypothetical protein [Saprospiraceae bacterium]
MKSPHSIYAILLFLGISTLLQAQNDPLLQGFHWRNIGPANQGGRIVDIEALETDFTKVWIATGSGGVWHSKNAGTTWEPIFDDYETASIGDIAVYQKDPSHIWVGTGESNNRNSVSWGNGIYKSTDGGESFQNMGLKETHQISRVIIHPDDPDVVYTAALGHLWGYSGTRGLFKTTDGGQTWTKLTKGLPDDGKTGAIDLVMDPQDPNTLYVAMYHRLRQPWHFHSGGGQGGIYKSTNGGKSWTKLSKGLPPGETGRIGLAIYRKNPKVLMALIEAEQTDDLGKPGSGVYRSEDGGKSWTYVNTYNNRPFYYSQIRINPNDDQRVYVLTTRFMVSEDGGKTLRNGSEDEEVHGDFHAMWLDPNYKDRYYLGADKGVSITHDHGQAFTLLDNLPIAQFYRIGLDMREPYYVYGGMQDNGMYGVASFSRDARGILNDDNWKLHWGDGMSVAVDPGNWRKVYTQSENGSTNRYDPLTYQRERITPNYTNISNWEEKIPTEKIKEGTAFRFNWNAPMQMSPFDPDILYLGGNHILKSNNGGQSWRIISPDLSTNDPQKTQEGKSGGITLDNTGAEIHCAATMIGLSPIDRQVIWVGTDDGNVQITRDGGQHWTNVRARVPNVPGGIWVSRVEASHFSPSRAYLSFDGHRSDQNQPWLFVTDDFGQTWTSLSANLPENEVIRVVREDHQNPDLLFIGTETGVFYTLDRGASWSRCMPNLPTVSVYDLKIHPRDKDLVAGTHGRSLWIMDDISPLQQLTTEVQKEPIWLFEQRPATLWENTSRGGQRGHFWFGGENPATFQNTSSKARARTRNEAWISYYAAEELEAPLILEIHHPNGRHVRIDTLSSTPGIHRYSWDLMFEPEALTAAEQAKAREVLEELSAQYANRSLERAAERFDQADTPLQQRRALSGLVEEGFLPASYGVPEAGPGIYWLTLRSGSMTSQQSLEVREDPILKK